MGHWINNMFYENDEVTIGPDGKPRPKRVKGFGTMPSPPPVPAVGGGPSSPVEATTEGPVAGSPAGTYETKIITPAVPEPPVEILTKADEATEGEADADDEVPSRSRRRG